MFICKKDFDKPGPKTAAVELYRLCVTTRGQKCLRNLSLQRVSKHLTSVFYSSISTILINSVYEYVSLHEGFPFFLGGGGRMCTFFFGGGGLKAGQV